MSFLRRLLPARPRETAPDVAAFRPGTLYAHTGEPGGVEFARILDLSVDHLGVYHVRFDLIYRYRHRVMEAGERTLALAEFSRRFSRAVTGVEERVDVLARLGL